MAKFVLKDAVITVDGDDISDHVSSVTIETTISAPLGRPLPACQLPQRRLLRPTP